MARTTGIGIQNFGKIIETKNFYVDKTAFMKEWWESGDEVTLIARPRCLGKPLTMSMFDHFFPQSTSGAAICLTDSLSGRRKLSENCREPIRSSAFLLQM